jgi:S1-C subfamily serine protease
MPTVAKGPIVHPDPEEHMMKKLAASIAAVLVLGASTAAFAGGAHCSGSGTASAAWCGAWLQRTASGAISVADVAAGSPAAQAGLRTGDIVTAVNGHQLNEGSCASGAQCSVGSAMTYTVQRGRSTRAVKVKLEKLPEAAAQRYAHRDAAFDPALAAIVMPAVN